MKNFLLLFLLLTSGVLAAQPGELRVERIDQQHLIYHNDRIITPRTLKKLTEDRPELRRALRRYRQANFLAGATDFVAIYSCITAPIGIALGTPGIFRTVVFGSGAVVAGRYFRRNSLMQAHRLVSEYNNPSLVLDEDLMKRRY